MRSIMFGLLVLIFLMSFQIHKGELKWKDKSEQHEVWRGV